MALGRRKQEEQPELWIATSDLPKSIGHVFYEKLNSLLNEAGFDRWIEELRQPYYHRQQGRPGIPPGRYFRMLLVGYFEGIGSQRGIAWRCTDEEVRRFDKKRKGKKVSNTQWVSSTDHDSRIAKMKDGRTHLAYKAENVIDVETELVLGASIRHADEGDVHTLVDSVVEAQVHLNEAGSDTEIQEVVADKGYHATETIALSEDLALRTYIPERSSPRKRNWLKVAKAKRQAVLRNRRRTQDPRSKRLQKMRSERVERSFAHMCDSGGARRTWLRGIEKVQKRYLISAMARNLGLVMRRLYGFGTPKAFQLAGGFFALVYLTLINICALMKRNTIVPHIRSSQTVELLATHSRWPAPSKDTFSTGC